ncbi:glycoside hydrolase family 26 protein [Streptomyces griseoaurantiacus]|uniref:glycoside hydrolase family 26 protein n=2 Tax=Streptomyces griseoaurantiacus TaxID=68213 RepID=UPI0036360F3F
MGVRRQGRACTGGQWRGPRLRRPVLLAVAVAASVTLAAVPCHAVDTTDPPPQAAATPPPAAAGVPAPVAAPAPVPPAAGPSPGAPDPGTPTAGTPTPGSGEATPTGTPASWPAFGAYLDYGALGVARIDELSKWLGGTELRVGHTYLPGDRWANIEGPEGFLDVWARWRRQRDDRMLVLNVPMMERNEAHVPDEEVRALLRRGAAGEFDRHFKALAERLVALKVPDTVIVLGWEMNGTTYTHRCGPDPENWKKYWNRIVSTMRAVPGQEFRFDFAPSRGRDAVPWTQCYPGDDTVDILGMDAYDQPRGLSFEEQVKEPYGLQAHVDFAKAHHKPVSYPEWGLFRNGDNPEYMRGMLDWMARHEPVYNTLTDYCPHGVWTCEKNPKAAEVYRSLLSHLPHVTPAPAPTPVPPAPTHPAGCSPLNLGDWVEYWLGGKLCVKFDWWSRSR